LEKITFAARMHDLGGDVVRNMFLLTSGMRIFADAEGKTNLDLKAVDGNLLIISQFTLYANCKKGNRPSFTDAASPEKGEELYKYFLELAKQDFPDLEQGEFGANMSVNLINDGPFTIYLDSDDL